MTHEWLPGNRNDGADGAARPPYPKNRGQWQVLCNKQIFTIGSLQKGGFIVKLGLLHYARCAHLTAVPGAAAEGGAAAILND